MGSMLSAQTTVVKAQYLVSSNLAGEEVILHLDLGVYYGLDPVGARIWALLEQPRTIEEICATICAEFAVTPTRCATDSQQFLTQLADAHLIEVSNVPIAEMAPNTR